MAPGGAEQRVYEFPLTGAMAGLLELEGVVRTLEEARHWEVPVFRHLAAERLAGFLPELAPNRLDATLIRETQEWTGYLEGLAARPVADSGKVERLRAGLEQLAGLLPQEWASYYEALVQDPWMASYLAFRQGEGTIHLGPEAWAASPEARDRLEEWVHLLEPAWTAAETILRLVRDSLQREHLRIPEEGHTLEWDKAPVSGLVEVQVGEGACLPVFEPGPGGLKIRLRSTEALAASPFPVDVVLGWFIL